MLTDNRELFVIDIILEITRALILLGLIIYLWRAGLNHRAVWKKGGRLILLGFGLLLFGCMLDITDNLPVLNRFVIVGDTTVHAFFEKIVGFTLGFIFLTFGLISWIPMLRESSNRIDQHEQPGRDLPFSREKTLGFDRKLTQQRIEIEKMEATSRMAVRVAHEINNPLAGIKNAFLLVKGGVSEDYQHFSYVERIEKEIERIANIIRQMLGLYYSEDNGATECDIRAPLNDAITLLAFNARERNVKIIQADCTRPLIVAIPEGLLRQVLFNVILNAIHASPNGSEINIVLESIEDCLMICVIDQGNGIPDDLMDKVFEPFFSSKLGHGGGGLGLGLYTSLKIVQSWNGSIDVKTIQDRPT